jgi:hypothetical protein
MRTSTVVRLRSTGRFKCDKAAYRTGYQANLLNVCTHRTTALAAPILLGDASHAARNKALGKVGSFELN